MVLWSHWLLFCDYCFSLSALWCPLATPTVLLGFLLPWTWGISSRLLQQSAGAAPYLGRGVSSHGRPSWLWTWSSSFWPSCAHVAATPWMWGISSRLLQQGAAAAPYLDEGYLLTAAPPDLECRVAPLALLCPCSSRSLKVGLKTRPTLLLKMESPRLIFSTLLFFWHQDSCQNTSSSKPVILYLFCEPVLVCEMLVISSQ